MLCPLSDQHRRCAGCGNPAEVIAERALTALDIPELLDAAGPVCYGVVMLCTHCAHMWVVVAAEPTCWYAAGGGD